MDTDRTIVKELYTHLNKKFFQSRILIKDLKVKRRGGHVYKILIKKNNKTAIYYAKYYSDYKRAYEIYAFNKYHFDSKKYQIARPIFLFDDIQTVVFNNIVGIKFSYLTPFIISPAYFANKSKANKILRNIAKCLTYFQKNTDPEIKNTIDIEISLSALKKIESLNNFEKSKITYILKNNHHSIGELPSLFNHSDFVSKNILISKDSIGLIDIDSFCFDNRIFDLHSFIVNLECRAMIPIYSKKIINKIRREFIFEYKKFYPVLLTEEILLYTKLNYLLLYLYEKQNLQMDDKLRNIKSQLIMKEIKKNIIKTTDLLAY